jgi:hypothetical protein
VHGLADRGRPQQDEVVIRQDLEVQQQQVSSLNITAGLTGALKVRVIDN